MANLIEIISTADGLYVDVKYNLIPSRFDNVRLQRTSIRMVSLMRDHACVEVTYQSGDLFVLTYQYIDNINGVVITSNLQLCEVLKTLMK